MGYIEREIEAEELHPIDIVEQIAQLRDWEFDRIGDDQIAMAVEGVWRSYAITLAWSEEDETLRLVCTFEMSADECQLPALMSLLNSVNDTLWSGGFTYWIEQRLMVYRYGLVLAGGQIAGGAQIDLLLRKAVEACEHFYPAFQVVTWGQRSPDEAMQIAIGETWGRA